MRPSTTPPPSPDWPLERQRAFVRVLARSGSVTAAAEAVGATRAEALRARRMIGRDGDFASAWTIALTLGRLANDPDERDPASDRVPIRYRRMLATARSPQARRFVLELAIRHALHRSTANAAKGERA